MPVIWCIIHICIDDYVYKIHGSNWICRFKMWSLSQWTVAGMCKWWLKLDLASSSLAAERHLLLQDFVNFYSSDKHGLDRPSKCWCGENLHYSNGQVAFAKNAAFNSLDGSVPNQFYVGTYMAYAMHEACHLSFRQYNAMQAICPLAPISNWTMSIAVHSTASGPMNVTLNHGAWSMM